ncbi:MAG: AMP-binding protein [SAR324 cluster bacterium]|nr:AMP-binding protein [SAR324 cluster bacterium]
MTDYVISADEKTYTFKIRSSAHWSDGTPVTAHDFVFSWRRMLHPGLGSDYAYQLADYVVGAGKYHSSKVEAGDKVEVELDDRPDADQLFPRGTILSGILKEIVTPKKPDFEIPAGSSQEVIDEKKDIEAKWRRRWTFVVEVKPTSADGAVDWAAAGMVRRFSKDPAEGVEKCEQTLFHFDDEVAKGEAEDLAILSYTSGTTGEPKAAMLSHKNLQASYTTYAEVEGWNEKDEMVAYLPMAWIGDFGFSVVSALAAGVTINCIESPETYRRDLREIGPTLFLGPPRQWENTTTTIQVRMEDADWIKRTLYETFLKLGLKVERLKQAGEPVPLLLKALNTLGRWLVWLPLLDAVGARRVRKAYTGGAPLGPDVFDFFRAQGINLKVGYGLTESAGFGLLQPDGEANSETVGVPLGDVELKIAENGEILMRGPNNFKGYYKDEEATRKAIDKDGWLYTGDAGFMDKKGHLRVIDRAKDVSKLKDGTLFAPQFLENKLKFSPYIKEAVTLGKERDYVAAIINIDLDSLENWAERKNVTYSGYQELSQKPEVYELIQEEITRINRSFSEDKELAGAQIRRFLILNKELDPDDGEITRTRKVRRGVISERYGKLIEALYSDADRVETDIVVTYEDGRTGTIHSDLRILDIGGPPTPRQEIKRSA